MVQMIIVIENDFNCFYKKKIMSGECILVHFANVAEEMSYRTVSKISGINTTRILFFTGLFKKQNVCELTLTLQKSCDILSLYLKFMHVTTLERKKMKTQNHLIYPTKIFYNNYIKDICFYTNNT